MKISSRPLRSCLLAFSKNFFQCTGPRVLMIFNSSLLFGQVHSYLKNAFIHPLVKEELKFDLSLHSSYPKLSFISKDFGKKFPLNNLQLPETNTLNQYQSGFRSANSTGKALLGVSNDI